MLAGPKCGLEEAGAVVLWRAEGFEGLEVSVDGQAAPCTPNEKGGGCSVQIPAEAALLAVRSSEGRRWELPLVVAPPPAWLAEARGLYRAGDFAAARTRIEQALPTLAPDQRATALGMLAFCAMAEDDYDRAIDTFRVAIDAAPAAADRLELMRLSPALVMLLLERHRPAEASAALPADLDPSLRDELTVRYLLAWQRGMVASYLGDQRAAMRYYQEAIEVARRAERPRQVVAATQALSDVEGRSGRHQQALATIASSVAELRGHPDSFKPGEESLALMNYAWALLAAIEAGEDPSGWSLDVPEGLDPLVVLEHAAAAGGADAARGAHHAANLWVNRALVAQQRGELQASADALAQARAVMGDLDSRSELWAWLIDGRLALARGDGTVALASFERMERLAIEADFLEAEWRARHGQALALEALGRIDAALARFDRSEALFLEQSFLVPLHLGRAALLAEQDRITRDHMALLLRAGRAAEALDLVRHQRAVFLAGLRPAAWGEQVSVEARAGLAQQRQEYYALREAMEQDRGADWQQSAEGLAARQAERAQLATRALELIDQGAAVDALRWPRPLRPPLPGEVLVALYPMESTWVVLARRGDETRVIEGEEPAALLEPLADWLTAAARVTLYPVRSPGDGDPHAWSVGGEPLATTVPVSYGIDLAAVTLPRPVGLPGDALVIADPDGSLRLAAEEGAGVVRTLSAEGVATRLLVGEAASRAGVLEGLRTAGMVHFAGHAEATEDPWGSYLRLALQERLTAPDVLAAPRVPPFVFLSACETAQSTSAPVETLGLAQAFITAGSLAVVATHRPLQDRLGYAFAASFYEALPGGDADGAYLAALREMRRQFPSADWRSFVLLRP
ncbi:MAG: CHAT domain-containing protein [Pseudomonadota bacterium]